MSGMVRRHRAYAIRMGSPPVTAPLWRNGDNPTDFGVHRWTERSQREVMAAYETRGNRIMIDVEHAGSSVEGEPVVTGGYATLEIRGGEPWLDFDWSAYAVDQIQTRQRLYLSPEYDVDQKTSEIVRLYRVSLVADPATYNARVLASASNGAIMNPTLAAILSLLGSVEDPEAAIAAVKGYIQQMADSDGAAVDAAAVDGDGAAPAKKDETTEKMAAAAKLRATRVAASTPMNPPDVPGAAPGHGHPTTETVAAAKAITSPTDTSGASVDIAATAEESTEEKSTTAPSTPAAKIAAGKIKAAADSALGQINAARRDLLIQTDGDRLEPSIRVWASTQSLQVVEGLLAAAPKRAEGITRVAATRGITQGNAHGASSAMGQIRAGLAGEELQHLKSGLGLATSEKKFVPYRDPESGNFIFPTVAPSEFRRAQAAAAAQGGA